MDKSFIKDLDTSEKDRTFSLINEHPQRLSQYKLLARLMREDKQYASAVTILKKGLAVAPGNKEIRSHLAKTYYEACEIEQAVTEYKSLIKDHPDDYIPYEKLEKICREHNRIEEAVSIYESINKGNKLRPRSFQRIHFLLVEKLQDYKRGVKNLRAAIKELGPDYRRCKNIGRLYAKLGDWKNAAHYYKMALDFKSDDADLIGLLGWALVDCGKLEEAERYFTKIRGSFQGMLSLAEVNLKQNKLSVAEKQLAAVSRRYPGNSRVQIGYGELSLRKGEPLKAIELCKDALRRVPSYFAFEQAHAYGVLSQASRLLGHKEDADLYKTIGTALRKGPDTYTALITLAEAHIQKGNLRLADAVLVRILELYGGNTRALINRCAIKLLEGDARTAIHFGEAGLRRVDLKYKDELLKGHRLLTKAYTILDDKDKAELHRRKAGGA
jgi:predicted Zn-dependent protease